MWGEGAQTPIDGLGFDSQHFQKNVQGKFWFLPMAINEWLRKENFCLKILNPSSVDKWQACMKKLAQLASYYYYPIVLLNSPIGPVY